LDDVLAIGASFDVVEFLSFEVENYLGRIVEENTSGSIGEDIA